MTVRSEIFQRYLGWCPHAGIPPQGEEKTAQIPRMSAGPEGMPDSPAAVMAMPDGFTSLSILILFATLFVGGYFWWPALVIGITGAGILVMYSRNRIMENT